VKTKDNFSDEENTIEQQFKKLYPDYDYLLESISHEKDLRKRKRTKTII